VLHIVLRQNQEINSFPTRRSSDLRRRQEVDDSIQYQRHALVLEGRTTDSRNDLAGQGALTQTRLDLFEGQLDPFQILVHEIFVGFSGRLYQLFTVFRSQLSHILRDLFLTEGHAHVGIVPVDGLHAQQVYLANEVFFRTDRQLNRHWRVAKAFLDLLDDAQEVGTL